MPKGNINTIAISVALAKLRRGWTKQLNADVRSTTGYNKSPSQRWFRHGKKIDKALEITHIHTYTSIGKRKNKTRP